MRIHSEERIAAALERIAAALEKWGLATETCGEGAENLRKRAEKVRKPLTDAQIQQRRRACQARYGKPVRTPLRKSTDSVDSPQLPHQTEAKKAKAVAVATTNRIGENTRALVATYCEAYKARYGTNPVVDGKVAGGAGNLLKHVALPRAQDLVQAFLQMEEKWFVTKAHAFDVLLANLNVVAVSLANGTKNPQERTFWKKVFGEEYDASNVSGTGHQDARQLGSASLPRSPGGDPMASLPRVR